MKISDLKTGHRITLRNRQQLIVLIGVSTSYTEEAYDGGAHVIGVDRHHRSYNWSWLDDETFYNQENMLTAGAFDSEFDIMLVENRSIRMIFSGTTKVLLPFGSEKNNEENIYGPPN